MYGVSAIYVMCCMAIGMKFKCTPQGVVHLCVGSEPERRPCMSTLPSAATIVATSLHSLHKRSMHNDRILIPAHLGRAASITVCLMDYTCMWCNRAYLCVNASAGEVQPFALLPFSATMDGSQKM